MIVAERVIWNNAKQAKGLLWRLTAVAVIISFSQCQLSPQLQEGTCGDLVHFSPPQPSFRTHQASPASFITLEIARLKKYPHFLVLGAHDHRDYGIGNFLAFFPAVFYFAVFTNRILLIHDQSYFGHFCSIIQCGIPFLSEFKPLYPELFSDQALAQIPVLNVKSFKDILGGLTDLHLNEYVVTASGIDTRSEWWVWYNGTQSCVAKLTGCDKGDISCSERFAYQTLVKGPFVRGVTIEKIKKQLHDLPDDRMHGLLNVPRTYAPRFDISLHLRNQFNSFENEKDVTSEEFQTEVNTWLKSSECGQVFLAMNQYVSEKIKALRASASASSSASASAVSSELQTGSSPSSSPQKSLANPPRRAYIYIAADNEAVKQAFKKFLLNSPDLNRTPVSIVTLDSRGIYHIKGRDRFRLDQQGNYSESISPLFHLVFDWYALSLSNTVYAWRKGGVKGISSFVYSAVKTSGSKERTTFDKGNSIGTYAFQLSKGRHDQLILNRFLTFPNMEEN